jgi:hypothetical protein
MVWKMRVSWPCVLCLIFIYYMYNCVSQSGIGLLHIRLYVPQVRMRKSVILQDGVYKSLGNSDCYVTLCINDVSATHDHFVRNKACLLISFVKKAVGKILDTE